MDPHDDTQMDCIYFVFSSIRHFLSWKDMSNVSAMYDKIWLSVATPFQTWETPSTESVNVCCMSNDFIFPKASQSSLTSLWLAQMPLNGMPSSKCSRRIVWTEQPWLQCRDHMSKWYLAGTVRLIFWTHTDFEWIKATNSIDINYLPLLILQLVMKLNFRKHDFNEFSVWFLLSIVSVYIASW